ncbi:MAG: V-type ATPase 116kDa subunit family protein [Syntrophales bacterium]|nr:V-type ATPase 116kDa subunit family protein [Syntrophales bacterium]
MIPLLINTPETMFKIRVVTAKDASAKALERLQAIGVLHIEEPQELDPADITAIEEKRNLIRKISVNINDILSNVRGEHRVLIPEDAPAQPLDKILHRTDRLRDKCARLREDATKLEADISNMEGLGRYLDILAQEINLPLRDLNYSGSYVSARVFVLPVETSKTFLEKAGPHILQHVTASSKEEVVLYTIARTTSQNMVEALARDLGSLPLEIPDEKLTLRDFSAKKEEIIGRKKEEIQELEREIETVTSENLEKIALYRETVSREDEMLSAIENMSETHYVSLIEGWVPQTKTDFIISEIHKSIDNAFVDARKPTPTDEPPTRLQNPVAIRPFEVIVSLFSLPKYGGWDPTPSVAYFFAFFFGLMLCDVVYAVGLLILARFVLDKLVDDPSTEGVDLFRKVLYISGGVSLIFGALSGTYLGDFLYMFFGISLQSIALVKWVQTQLSDPISFITISLIIGLVHVNIAHILGLVKGAMEGDWGMIVSKAGLFLVEAFGIPYIFKAMLGIELIPLSPWVYGVLAYPMTVGLILIVVGAFMQMGALGSVFWIFDLTGILGDIMSYSRLAGVGLATFYLASSFNLLSNWVSSTVSSVVPGMLGAVLAFAIGMVMLTIFHVFNLFLSSLAAFIHSLRLCFVEFLLKFYEGGGKEYNPFHLSVRRETIVGKKF